MTKKIILLLVEGPTDEDALALVFSNLVNDHDIEFEVLHTDGAFIPSAMIQLYYDRNFKLYDQKHA